MATSPNDPQVKALRLSVQEELAARTRAAGENEEEQVRAMIRRTVADVNAATGFADAGREAEIVQILEDDFLGLGPLERLLREGGHSEIMVDGGGYDPYTGEEGRCVPYVEDDGVLVDRPDVEFDDEDPAGQKRRIIDRIAAMNNKTVNEERPWLDATLRDGSRVHAELYPLAANGHTIDIRVFKRDKLSMDQLVEGAMLTPNMARFLGACVRGRLNIVVSGGTGSGKTTTLNCLSEFIPGAERIITLEDTRELQLRQRRTSPVVTREPNGEGRGEITMQQALRNALRNRPDRIIVGEVRGPEALDMLQAMQTGHDGSLTTIHASDPREAIGRIVTCVQQGASRLPESAILQQVAQGIDLIVQTSRLQGGARAVTEITCVTGMEGDVVTLEPLFRLEDVDVDASGAAVGTHAALGTLPPERVGRKLAQRGARVDDSWFFGREPFPTYRPGFSGVSPEAEDGRGPATAGGPAGMRSAAEPAAAPKPPATAGGLFGDAPGMPANLVPMREGGKRRRSPWSL